MKYTEAFSTGEWGQIHVLAASFATTSYQSWKTTHQKTEWQDL